MKTRSVFTIVILLCLTGCGLRPELPGVKEHTDEPDCTGDACRDATVTLKSNQGYVVKNNGKKKIAVTMRFGNVQAPASVTVILGAGKENGPYADCGLIYPYDAKYVSEDETVSPPSDPVIENASLDREDINAGETLILTVTFTRAAPLDGIEIAFSASSHDGSMSVLVDYPYGQWSSTVRQGRSITIPLRTRRVQNRAMKVFLSVKNARFSCNEQQLSFTVR